MGEKWKPLFPPFPTSKLGACPGALIDWLILICFKLAVALMCIYREPISWTNAVHFSFYSLDEQRIQFFDPLGGRVGRKYIFFSPKRIFSSHNDSQDFPKTGICGSKFFGFLVFNFRDFLSSLLDLQAVFSLQIKYT